MRRIGAWIALLTGTLAVAGCFNPFSPLVSTQRVTSAPAPVPNSPANVIRLFEWCWNNRGINEYEEIFTDDYRFQFALGDSAGNAYRDVPFTREDELRTARGLFVGSTDRDAAADISLSLDKTLIGLPDDRPGKDPKWHKSIRSKVNLAVTLNEGGATVLNDVNGFAKFYLVRGDSAVIPPELKDKGFKPDSSRWWIERWEDETLPAGGALAPELARARPATANPDIDSRVEVSFGQLKTKR